MIGSRIRLVREILGLTQEELAAALDTTQSGVASMEAGIYRPSSSYLDIISQRTGFKGQFFSKGELPDFPFGSILYRAQTAVKQASRTKAHALAHIEFELALGLAERLKRIPSNVPKLDEGPQRAAQITRATFGLSPDSPIRGLLRHVERNGVFVLSVPMEVDGFDGFSAWAGHDPPRPIIALLGGKTPYREVFTVAEETGHLVMHNPLRANSREADLEARMFAQEFLLPEDAMRAEMQPPVTLTSLAAMKPRWGVSIAFLAKRADSLFIVTPNQYRYLVQQMRSAWGTRSEPGDDKIIPERPRLLGKMAEMLYGDPINFTRLGNDSGLPVQMLRELLGGQQTPGGVLQFKRS